MRESSLRWIPWERSDTSHLRSCRCRLIRILFHVHGRIVPDHGVYESIRLFCNAWGLVVLVLLVSLASDGILYDIFQCAYAHILLSIISTQEAKTRPRSPRIG